MLMPNGWAAKARLAPEDQLTFNKLEEEYSESDDDITRIRYYVKREGHVETKTRNIIKGLRREVLRRVLLRVDILIITMNDSGNELMACSRVRSYCSSLRQDLPSA